MSDEQSDVAHTPDENEPRYRTRTLVALAGCLIVGGTIAASGPAVPGLSAAMPDRLPAGWSAAPEARPSGCSYRLGMCLADSLPPG